MALKKLDQPLTGWRFKLAGELGSRLRQAQAVSKEHTIGAPDLIHLLAMQTRTSHAYAIEPGHPPFDVDKGEREHVSSNAGVPSDHRELANANKLVDNGAAPQSGTVADLDVSTQQDVIDKCHVVSDRTVMANVAARQEETVFADSGHGVRRGASVDRDVLSQYGPPADATIASLSAILDVLGSMPDDDSRVQLAVLANLGPTGQVHAVVKAAARGNMDMSIDHTVGAHFHAAVQLGLRISDRCGVDRQVQSPYLGRDLAGNGQPK